MVVVVRTGDGGGGEKLAFNEQATTTWTMKIDNEVWLPSHFHAFAFIHTLIYTLKSFSIFRYIYNTSQRFGCCI